MEQLELRTLNIAIDSSPPVVLKVQYDLASARLQYPQIVEWVREAPFLQLGHRAMEALVDIIVYWDLENDDGTLYCPTVENMKTVPVFVLSRVIEAIRDDIAA